MSNPLFLMGEGKFFLLGKLIINIKFVNFINFVIKTYNYSKH